VTTRYAPNLAHLPAINPDDPETVLAVVETSKGSRNKFAYHAETGTFRLKHVLPEGSAFPYDFGFVPSTQGGDGDPLDVLAFLDEPAPHGSIVAVRLIGVLEARQRTEGQDWAENNRFLGVAAASQATGHVRDLEDLRPYLVDEIEAFFAHYNRMRNTEFEVLARGGPKRARQLLEAGITTRA
jgi:inorganic pyrophosphatase